MSAETGSIDHFSKGNETPEAKGTSLSQMDWGKASEDSKSHSDLNTIKSSWKYGEKMDPTPAPLESKIAEGARLSVESIQKTLDDPSGIPIETSKKVEFLASTQKEIDLLEAQLIDVGSQKLSPQEFQKKITEIYTAAVEKFSQIAAEANGLKNGPAGSLDAKGKEQLVAAQRRIAQAFDTPFKESLELAQRAAGKQGAEILAKLTAQNNTKEPPVGSSDRYAEVTGATRGLFQDAFPGGIHQSK
jgi:hypothetical protein